VRRLAVWLILAWAWLFGRRKKPAQEEAREPGKEGSARRVEFEPGATRRMENVVILVLLATAGAAIAFAVLYVAYPDTQLLGATLGGALAALALAAVIAGKRLVPQETAIEEREDFGDEDERDDVGELVAEAGEGVSRRGLLLGAAGTAGAGLGVALAFPVASLGPRVDDTVRRTPWRAGRRVVDSKGEPITADRIEPGMFLTGFPEGAARSELGASIVIVQVPLDELELPPERLAGAPEGIVAYSKICTHAACAVSMYRHPLHEPTSPRAALVCPCHYSTFDVARGAEVIFGPAARPLPQLPLRIGSGRELVCAGEYTGQIGPSYDGVRQQ
jgi:ubiquinol-cytochrome c reductase iron-sulfur subunit